jgi:hypothetical protein
VRDAVTDPNAFEFLAHVDPPPGIDEDHPGLFHYIGPRLFPVGVYMPKGFDIEARPGNDPSWTVFRARCMSTMQVMCQWALQHEEGENGEPFTVDMDLME